jgi:hypothetical protein
LSPEGRQLEPEKMQQVFSLVWFDFLVGWSLIGTGKFYGVLLSGGLARDVELAVLEVEFD